MPAFRFSAEDLSDLRDSRFLSIRNVKYDGF
jgi:hypothetical protein